MVDYPRLPEGFVLGAATAAYQVEGAVATDGRGPSVWDTFCAEPDRVVGGETGDVACDHYRRMPEDVAWMAELGLDAYRFSLSWSRILPTGTGEINQAGLDFYDRLVDALLDAGITPAVTLFHWDLPQAIQDAGGWLSRQTSYHLGAYAEVVAARLADRVGMWMPLNEPVVHTMFGHALGNHAPGLSLGFDALPAVHHQLLGHGLAVQALRAAGATQVGIANNHQPVWAAGRSEVDLEAARGYDDLINRLFADPVLLGRYPEGYAEAMPGPVNEDLTVIGSPLDFYGINYYEPVLVGSAEEAGGEESRAVEGQPLPEGLPFVLRTIMGFEQTDFGWPVVPAGLTEILGQFTERYRDALPPLFVTENGCSIHEEPTASGELADPRRIAYLDSHLRAVAEAIEAGADVRGYFVWSLLDNFEWAAGYAERFGLLHVDFETQVRTPKASFGWYRDLIASRRPKSSR